MSAVFLEEGHLAALRAAAVAEREACLKAVEDAQCVGRPGEACCNCKEIAAAAIRARSEKETP